ncbi:replication-relaxation family protein [Streptomyces drozdowiczii]
MRKSNAAGSTNTVRADVLRVLGVLKVATTDQIQRIAMPHLNHRHSDKATPAKRKTARTATHTAALADLRTHRLAATGGSTSTGEALRHLTLKGLEAAATELQRPLSEMGATARGAGAAGASRPMAVNETVIGLLRPKPALAKMAADPPGVRAAAQAVVDAPGGVGSIGSYWTEVPLPVSGSWSTPGRGGAQADIVLTAPQEGVPLLFVEVDNCHETAEELADKLEKYARFFRRKVKDTEGKAQPMWRTRWTTPPWSGLENPYPPVLFVFNQLGARNPERTPARLAGLTRHLWAGDKDYEADFHHYDKKIPVITTTLADLRDHGPHGQVFRRFGRPGPQTLFDAIGNPRRQAALERHWAQQRAREHEAQERECQKAEQRATEREAQRPACARCGSMFTDERWSAAQATDWGTPADSHPTLCDRCKRRASSPYSWPRPSTTVPSPTTRRTTRSRRSRRGSPAAGSHVGAPEGVGGGGRW